MAGIVQQELPDIMEDHQWLLHPMPVSRHTWHKGRKVLALSAAALGLIAFAGLGGFSHHQHRSSSAPRDVVSEWAALSARGAADNVTTAVTEGLLNATASVVGQAAKEGNVSAAALAKDLLNGTALAVGQTAKTGNVSVAALAKGLLNATALVVDQVGEEGNATAAVLAKVAPLIGGLPGGLSEVSKGGEDVQALADAVKEQVPDMLAMEGWNVGLGDFKVISYCKQIVAGTLYYVKVAIADDTVSKVVNSGEVLQLTLYLPAGNATSTTLTAAVMVARDDSNCMAMPLTPPPALPHVMFDATAKEQGLVDAVKEKVPSMLAMSGWKPSLEPYKALAYCGDGSNYIIKVQTAKCLDKACKYPLPYLLQLLLHAPAGKGADAAQLIGALMVLPTKGSCASLPVLPSLDEASVQALGDVEVPKGGPAEALAQATSKLMEANLTTKAKIAETVANATAALAKAAKLVEGVADGASIAALVKAADAADSANGTLAKANKGAKDAADAADLAANASGAATGALAKAAQSANFAGDSATTAALAKAAETADAATGALAKAAESAKGAAGNVTSAGTEAKIIESVANATAVMVEAADAAESAANASGAATGVLAALAKAAESAKGAADNVTTAITEAADAADSAANASGAATGALAKAAKSAKGAADNVTTAVMEAVNETGKEESR